MSQEDAQVIVHPDALELARLMRPAWSTIDRHLRYSGVPLNEGDTDDTSIETGDGDTDVVDAGDDAATTFPKEVVEKLRRENAAARKRAQEAEARAKEFEDRDKTEQQKLAEKAEAAEKRASDAEAKVLRAEVAAEKGVPAKLAKFLTGSTREELESAAAELVAELGEQRPTSFDGGADRGNGAASDGGITAGGIDDAIRRAAGRT